MRILAIFISAFLLSCTSTKQVVEHCNEYTITPVDLEFRETAECAEYSDTIIKAEVTKERIHVAVAAPRTCGLGSRKPSYSRRGDTLTVSIESDYNGGPLAACLCWRVMNFNLPATSIGGEIPKKVYFVQDSSVYGEADISK